MSMSCGEGCASPPVSIGGIILGISIFVLITVTYLYFDKRKT